MAPSSTIHIVRHAEGFHQLPHDQPDVSIHDPSLTSHGMEQCRKFKPSFPYHESTDLLCASPLRRTIQTASLAFAPELERGLKILAVADAQEATDELSDTGSAVTKLTAEFGETLDVSLLEEGWYKKKGSNAVSQEALQERACRLRKFLRERPENQIVLVSHGAFAHYITEHVDPEGHQTGEYWHNVMWRTFTFEAANNEYATLCETDESRQRHGVQ